MKKLPALLFPPRYTVVPVLAGLLGLAGSASPLPATKVPTAEASWRRLPCGPGYDDAREDLKAHHGAMSLNLACGKLEFADWNLIEQQANATEIILYCVAFSSWGLKRLENLPNLRRLTLKGCGLVDQDLECLSGLHQLEYLSLEDNPITGEELKALRGLKGLKKLYLYNCPCVTVEDEEAFWKSREDKERGSAD